MRLFGLEIRRVQKQATLSPVADNRGGWWPIVREANTGFWQRNIVVDQQLVLSYHAVYACITLIAGDIAKLRVKLVQQDRNGIWNEVTNPAYSPVLRKPNRYQNRIQFWETWIISKLIRGNTYVLKERDNRNVVVRLWPLDPSRVQPMVADDGSVFYQLQDDNLSGLRGPVLAPASEIIHDRFNCLFHPLVGVSPIYANGLAATQGLKIQNHSTKFFDKRAVPGGVLSAPGFINDDTAERLKKHWQENYSGENAGDVAVLGDGLKFEPMGMTSVDAQLIEQLRWTAEVVCSTFHVPPYKIGVGPQPTHNNIEALQADYYATCLQTLIEAAEVALDEGLGLGEDIGTQFDLDGLLRMDTKTLYETIAVGIKGGFLAPNDGRRRIDHKPLEGGDTVYLQEQNFSLAALAKRDAKEDPFAKGQAPAATPAPSREEPEEDAGDAVERGADQLWAEMRQYELAA